MPPNTVKARTRNVYGFDIRRTQMTSKRIALIRRINVCHVSKGEDSRKEININNHVKSKKLTNQKNCSPILSNSKYNTSESSWEMHSLKKLCMEFTFFVPKCKKKYALFEISSCSTGNKVENAIKFTENWIWSRERQPVFYLT